MNKELQDKAWAALPKEVREEVRNYYGANFDGKRSESARFWLSAIFGSGNIESDAEPEELLCVKRSEIIALYDKIGKHIEDNQQEDNVTMLGVQSLLLGIFGKNCRPDDKPAKSNHFVDVWFKYNVGDIVSFKGKVKKIIWRRNNNALVTYGAVSPRGGNEICVQESDLEPMFPKFKVGDKVFLKPMKSYATVSEVEHNGVSFCYKLDIFCTYVSEGRLERYTGQEQPLSLSDAELDEVIARLTAIRDRRRENDNELRKILKSYGAVFA